MAIPFFLLTANEKAEKAVPMFIISLFITMLPLAIPFLVQFTKNPKNYGMVITTVGGILLFGLYKLFMDLFQVKDMGSRVLTRLGVRRQAISAPMVLPKIKAIMVARNSKPSVQGKSSLTISSTSLGKLAREKPRLKVKAL